MHFPVFALGAALCFVLPQENGLPRRFAPRNDRGGGVIANRCLAPADTRHVSAHLARRVLATADTPPSSACHCEPVRTLVRQSVFPAAMPGKSVVLRANSQLFRIRREELLFGLCCRRSYGLPRRFAPRNDMQKLAACPHNTWALPVYCRSALAPVGTFPPFACHCVLRSCNRSSASSFCMSLRTSAHTGAAIRFPAEIPGKLVGLRANPQPLSYSPKVLLFVLSHCKEKRIATSLRSSQ